MDLSNLKNIDLKDIIEKFKSGGLSDKKFLIKLGVGSNLSSVTFLKSVPIFNPFIEK